MEKLINFKKNIKSIKKYVVSEDIQNCNTILDNITNLENNNIYTETNLIKKHDIYDDEIQKDNLYNDLEIFTDYKNGTNTLFNKLNKTYTKGGSYYLKELLSNPSHNIDFLEIKKKSLEKLFKNIELNEDEFILKLNKLKDNQNNIFWILNQNTTDADSLINILYFNNFFLKKLNNSSYILSAKNIYKIFLSPVIGIMSPIVYFIVPFLVIRFKFKLKLNFITYIKIVYKYYVNMNFGNILSGSKINFFRKIWMIFSILFYFNGIFNSVELSKLSHKLNMLICNHINNISEYIKNGYSLVDKLYNNDVFKNIFNNTDYNIRNVKYLLNFINLQKCSKEYLINFGEKLKLYKFIKKDLIKEFVNVTYLCDSIVSLYLIKKEYKLNYSKLIKSNEPSLNIKGLKHPNISNAVKNDIILDNNNNLIITGPNAGGKSTFIKSIAINIILSQTICMNFCDDLELTPFYYISSQMNIVDDKGSESLFEAEMNRIVSNINNINECSKNNKFSILFLDELFNSTNIIEGICGSYSICKKLSDKRTNITLLTTHYTYLYKLEKNTKRYKNYKMNAIINDEEIVFPYKLIKGYSKQYVALELLKKNKLLEKNKDIFEEAINFKNNLVKKKKKEKENTK